MQIIEPPEEQNLTQIFINKFKIVEEELDESLFFLEMIVEFNKDKRDKIATLYKEGEELLKMIVSTLKTLRKK